MPELDQPFLNLNGGEQLAFPWAEWTMPLKMASSDPGVSYAPFPED